jgi:hypothetical protein
LGVRLIDYTSKLFILAHREDTTRLAASLEAEGFDCTVQRQVHQPDQADFARSYLCFLNHVAAWRWVLEQQQPAVIIEADFVPVQHMGQLPLPFNPQQADVGMAWLYTCAAQVYNVSAAGHAQGYSSSMVAYLITPAAVPTLLSFFERISQSPGPQSYYPWDSDLDKTLLAAGFRNYVPFRNYGEHGSDSPNPEHEANQLGRTHRADVLYGPLAFAPDYAASEGFWRTRLGGRIKGLGRLGLGRYARPQVLRDSEMPLKILGFALRRQLSLRL